MWLKLLSNYHSSACRMVYHDVLIRDYTLLKAVKELLLHYYFKLDTTSLSTYLPLCLCGEVLLLPALKDPAGSLHTICPCTQIVDGPNQNVLRNGCLPPPHALPHRPYPYCLHFCIYQGPLPIPAADPPLCHIHNPPGDPMVKTSQNRCHCVRDHPYFTPIQDQFLDNRLAHHRLGLY